MSDKSESFLQRQLAMKILRVHKPMLGEAGTIDRNRYCQSCLDPNTVRSKIWPCNPYLLAKSIAVGDQEDDQEDD